MTAFTVNSFEDTMFRKQHITIFTTASLPWMTGTAVNPLFRAAYLAKNGDKEVTLVIPWLSFNDQVLVYPSNITFHTPSEHESYVRDWLEQRVNFTLGFNIQFYPGKFSKEMRSILPVGDITECVSDEHVDIVVLEEPEHLNWYHHGKKWKDKFRCVIGVIHTNYLEYVKREKNGQLIAFFLKYANSWVTRIYCHKIIRLSAATQDLKRSVICNVHGVNPKFLEIGKTKLEQLHRGDVAFTKGAYYIGKMVWSKGYRELLQLLANHQRELSSVEVDLYGSGEDSDQIQESAKRLSLTVRVYPGRDHADPIFHDYKVFLNPSTTDVVFTTTAEALAMGKIVVCANHPSNDFFKQFPNCYVFNSNDEFVKLSLKALSEEPTPLPHNLRHELSWEAATERFVKAAEVNQNALGKTPSFTARKLKKSLEDVSASLHQTISGFEPVRRAFGAIPKSLQPDEQQKELGLVLVERKRKRKQSLLHSHSATSENPAILCFWPGHQCSKNVSKRPDVIWRLVQHAGRELDSVIRKSSKLTSFDPKEKAPIFGFLLPFGDLFLATAFLHTKAANPFGILILISSASGLG